MILRTFLHMKIFNITNNIIVFAFTDMDGMPVLWISPLSIHPVEPSHSKALTAVLECVFRKIPHWGHFSWVIYNILDAIPFFS
jgi:hypothetical protein